MTQPIDDAVRQIGAVLGRERDAGGLSPGDRAELRRMYNDPLDPALPPAFWRLLNDPKVADGVAALPGDREDAERAFAILIQAMLEAGGAGETLPIGKALAGAGYAEPRFVRLLRARGLPDVAAEVRAAARWCALQTARVRFSGAFGFGGFILAAALQRDAADRHGRTANSHAHAMARDYFAGTQTKPDSETASHAA
jgi:hypothetical protein